MQLSIGHVGALRARTRSTHDKRHRMLALTLAFVLLIAVTAAFAQTAQLMLPKGSTQILEGPNGTRIDFGNSADGYVIVQQEPVDKSLMLTISKGETTYTYALNNQGRSESYPLQMGNGQYKVNVYQQWKGNQYVVLGSASFDVKLNDQSTPYLYPSQYVNYTAGTLAVAKSNELCKNARSEREAVDAVFNYIKKTIKYSKKLAKTVKTGYLPNLDEVFRSRKGICFDYAALMACMLRVQGIPTQLVIGYVNDKYYHAWNKVLVGGQWLLFDATFAASGTKGKSYREERCY